MQQFIDSKKISELFSRIEYLEEKVITLQNRLVNVEYDVGVTNSNLRDKVKELEFFPNPYSDEGEANCNFNI
ncbi:hypothetical protein AFK68_08055 [Hydrocoleum sp. CS-953]|uniref:hypothetical protein n=1 Tax=Hydrocoleum sp. CS-953 TaxID=1671698 RepID=UPI000B9B3D0B|nr:hypothetical protein [Hydrocoleum sp. CS-953]OZH54883.1 hypothetical protein AFK68_08055 [Hydrocoleum sp. CS-953]